jgi:integrase
VAKRKDRGLRRGQGYTERRTGKDGTVYYIARWPEGDRYPSKVFRDPDPDAALEAAEQHVRDMARRSRSVAPQHASILTVEDLINQYLERRQRDWKPGTHVTYCRRAQSYVFPYIGAVRLRDLTKPRIQQWIDQLRREGKAPETIYAASAVMTASMREAARLGLVTENPATGIRLPKIPRKVHVTWSLEDIGTVYAATAGEPKWNAIYRVAIATGMRPGELRALKWPDVDLDRNTITVRRTITRDDRGREVVGETTKTGEIRLVAIPTSVSDALRRWRTAQKVERLAAKRWYDRDHVFTSRHGEELSASVWQRFHRALAERTGVPVITLHELRHTVATLELDAGTHPKVVQERLGHKRIQTTLDTYSHLSPDLQRAAADALDRRIVDATTSASKKLKKG